MFYHYCYLGSLIICWGVLLGGILGPLAVFGIIFYFSVVVRKQPVTMSIFFRFFRDIGKTEIDYFSHASFMILIYPIIYMAITTWLKIFPITYRRDAFSLWQFGCKGGAYRTSSINRLPNFLQRFCTFRWKDIQQIRYRDGDIHFISRNILVRYFFFLPRESFVNVESATRFYETVMVVWKSEGDMVAIPSAIFAEFAQN